MIHVYARRVGWFVGFVLLQVLVLNHVHVGGYATPFFYVYFILKFNTDVSRNELMLWAFFMGLLIDVFSNTPGVNAASAVLLAFVRPMLIGLFSVRDMTDSVEPGFKEMGVGPFVRYAVTGVLLHHAALLTIETFSFGDLSFLSLRIVVSSLFTVLCILGIESIRKS